MAPALAATSSGTTPINNAIVYFKGGGDSPFSGALTNIRVVIGPAGASTLGETFDSLGHEVRHLSRDNIKKSRDDPDEDGPLISEQEIDANRFGHRTRLFFEK